MPTIGTMTPDTEVMDFDHLDESSDKPSWSFRLGGREWHTRQADDIPMSVVENVLGMSADGQHHPYQGKALEDGPEDAPCTICNQPPGVPEHYSNLSLDDFFAAVIMPGEVEAFLEMKRRPDSPLTLRNTQPLLREISQAVLRRRPTNRSARRARGSAKTAGTSKAGSRSRATPRKRSTPAA